MARSHKVASATVGQVQPGDATAAGSKIPALRVSVLNGDLQFVRHALLVGHYRSTKLTGTEAIVDRLVDNQMSRALRAGLYPDAIGSNQIFGNHRKNPNNPLEMARPAAAVVVGLGEEGKLRAVDLVYTVRQAVLAYAQRLSEREGVGPAQFEMAATLIGSGGTGISAGSAAQLIAQGALEANLKVQDSSWPQLGQLTLIELYLERANDAWHALQLHELAAPSRLKLVGKVQSGPGALQRPLDSSYRGAAYDFISAMPVAGDDPANPCIAYALDTKRARTEVRAQHTQGTLLRQLVATASNDANNDPHIGRTLFNLLVPVEMETFLSGTSEMLIEVEPGTAVIPWELLDTNPDGQSLDQRPWAIRCKLLRKLRTADIRPAIMDASPDDSVLVIGEPKCDPTVYPSLEGARREAIAVAERLSAQRGGLGIDRVRSLVDQNDAQTIINALFERRYRLVHVAGHGEPGAKGGVVLSGKETYLGANEVSAMRTVPELVFLNCCHLAGRDSATTLTTYDRPAFAANIAEELIRVGVRCVIAAGWAVEDEPAEKFATTFYECLLGGARFIDAVAAARNAAWIANRQGNTWAAYQCYGDPEWTWRPDCADSQQPARVIADDFAGVASPVALVLALETLATECKFSRARLDRQVEKLRYLESEFAPLWRSKGAVAEAFGNAFASVNVVDKAVEWYSAALEAEDGGATLRAVEQLGNLLVRRAEKLKDPAEARDGVSQGIMQLKNLVRMQPTIERESLLGSAYKRLTVIESHAGCEAAARTALDAMVKHYGAAEAIARKAGADNLYYPAKNAISAELRAAFLNKCLPQFDDVRMKAASDSLRKAATDSPDFWSVVGQTELLILEAVAKGQLATAEPGITASFRDLKSRVPAPLMWDSVYNEAQFSLEPYSAMAGAEEQRAAKDLLALLKKMAVS